MSRETELLGIIDAFLEGASDFAAFSRTYYSTYAEATDLDTIPPSRRDLFSDAQDWLDFADTAPDAESRAAGWIDATQYRARLAEARRRWSEQFGH
jgi:hypothetical protein